MKTFHYVMLALGVALFAWLVHKTGLAELWRDARTVGIGAIPFILMEGLADVFHVWGSRYTFQRRYRTVPFWRLYGIRLSGSSINYVTPTGTSGEVVKAALLKPFCPVTEAASAILIDKLSFAIGQLALAAIGSSLLLFWVRLRPWWVAAILWAASLVVGAGVFGFFLFQRRGKMGAVFHAVCGFFAGEKGHRWVDKHISGLDESLKAYHASHGWDLLASVLLHCVGFVVGMLQAAWFLWLFDGRVDFFRGAAIWLLGTWFDMVSDIVPAKVGVLEGSRLYTFNVLGIASGGMLFALLLRVEQLTYTALGFLCYGWEVKRIARPAVVPPGSAAVVQAKD